MGKFLGVSVTTIILVVVVAVLAKKYGNLVPVLKNF